MKELEPKQERKIPCEVSVSDKDNQYIISVNNVNKSNCKFSINTRKMFGQEMKCAVIDYSDAKCVQVGDSNDYVETSTYSTKISKQFTIPSQYSNIDPKIKYDKNSLTITFKKNKPKVTYA